jgi:hypothetical protein
VRHRGAIRERREGESANIVKQRVNTKHKTLAQDNTACKTQRISHFGKYSSSKEYSTILRLRGNLDC